MDGWIAWIKVNWIVERKWRRRWRKFGSTERWKWEIVFGECGVLRLSEPIDACSPLTNKVALTRPKDACTYSFLLIARGGCSFEEKVRRAQSAGFKAAVVYDNEDDGVLISMAGNSAGIKIHAVFVSKVAGEVLTKYADFTDMELWIYPSFENSAWSIMAISFICLLVISAVLATCFFVRKHRIRRGRSRAASGVKDFHGMSSNTVNAMPSVIFTSVLEGNCTSRTCAICLEDYSVGERLRILPCRHQFHVFCVDSWLTSWRTFCPVCKRDARTRMVDPPASECTPLLSSTPASVASTSVLSSSSAIRIAQPMSRSPSDSHIHLLSQSPRAQQSHWAHRHCPPLCVSQSSVDLTKASSQESTWAYRWSPSPDVSQSSVGFRNAFQRSHSSYVATKHSLGCPPTSPIPSSSNASASCVGSSSQHLLPLSFSLASAQSLPGCWFTV